MPTDDELKQQREARLSEEMAKISAMTGSGKQQEDLFEKNLRNPIRVAALAALSGENPIPAVKKAYNDNTTVSGEQVANKLLSRFEEGGMPLRAPGQEEYMLQKPMGAVIDTGVGALTPTGIPGGAGVMGSMKLLKAEAPAVSEAAKRIAARFGKTEAAIAPKMASGALTEAEQLGQKAIPLSSGEAYKKKIADLVEQRNQGRLNAEMGDLMSKTDQPYMPANMKANNVRVKLEELAQKRADQIAARKKIAE